MKNMRKIICIIVTLIIIISDCTAASAAVKNQVIRVSGKRDYTMAYDVLKSVNKERKKAGLNSLKMDKSLLETAMKRAAECSVNFSHTRPDGSMCFTLNDKMMAENIAVGQNSVDSVMNTWMNSKGHADNILSANAKSVGIGCYLQDGIYYWVQCFGYNNISKSYSKPKNKNVADKISITADSDKYKFRIELRDTAIKKNKTATAKLVLINPGFSFSTPKIGNSVITWKSSNTKVATVSSNGKIKGRSKGTVTITAKLKYFTIKKKITVK